MSVFEAERSVMSYVTSLTVGNLVPLYPSLRGGNGPAPQTKGKNAVTNLNNELSIDELDFVVGGADGDGNGTGTGRGDGLGKLRRLEGAILDGLIGVAKSIGGVFGGLFPH